MLARFSLTPAAPLDDEHELPPRFVRVESLLLATGIAAVSIIAPRSAGHEENAVALPDERGSTRRSPAGARSCRMSPVQRSRDRDAVWRSSWGSDGIDARFGIMFAAGRDATESLP